MNTGVRNDVTSDIDNLNDRHNDDQHPRTVPWRRYWRIAKAFAQIVIAQLLAWALQKWWE